MLARFQGSPLVGAPQQGLSVGFFPHHRQFVPGPGIILVWIAGMQRRTASFFCALPLRSKCVPHAANASKSDAAGDAKISASSVTAKVPERGAQQLGRSGGDDAKHGQRAPKWIYFALYPRAWRNLPRAVEIRPAFKDVACGGRRGLHLRVVSADPCGAAVA